MSGSLHLLAMLAFFGALLLVYAPLARAAISPALTKSLQTLRQVGPEGRDNAAAREAWKKVAESDATAIPKILEAMDGANDLGLNWLRAAIEAIVGREQSGGKSLPMDVLEKFVKETRHHPRARRFAYELIAQTSAPTAQALIANMLDDPSSELRRDAVEGVVVQAAQLRTAGKTAPATEKFQTALKAARDVDQIEAIAKNLRELGQPVDLPKVFGWITDWKVIGPFDNTGNAGFEMAFPPEEGIDLGVEYEGKTAKVGWKEFTTRDDYGRVDLNKPLGALKSVTGYAYAEFYARDSRPVEIRLGCKNGWKIWLNGKFIFGREEYHRGAEIDQYRLPVELKPGKNRILVKVTQNDMVEDWTKEWEFQLRITDSLGTPIPQ